MRMGGRIRRVATAAGAVLLAAGMGGCGTSVSVVTEGVAQGPTVAIGVAADQPGLGWLYGGEYSGFDIDVAKYVAKTLGYAEKQVVFRQVTPSARITSFADGTVDMIVDSFSVDDASDGRVDVSGPYLTVHEALLVRSDESSAIKGTDDLDGKTVCAVTGSTASHEIRDRAGNAVVRERGTYPQCVTALMVGEADAIATDDAIATGLAANNKGDHLSVVDIPDAEWSYGIAVKSGQSELVGQIDAALRTMAKDGSWRRAVDDMNGMIGYVPDVKTNPPAALSKDSSSDPSTPSEK